MLKMNAIQPSVSVPQKQQALYSQAPRFGNAIPVLPQKTMADTFFQWPALIDSYFTKNWLASSNPVKRWVGVPLKTVVGAFSNHDYSKSFSIGGLGKAGVSPPLGAIATIVIPVTLLGRLYCSMKRSSDVDSRELGDILRRDIPTLAILVYMLDPLVNTMSHMIQRGLGLQLMTHLKDANKGTSLLAQIKTGFTSSAEPLKYTQLDRYYYLNSPTRLAGLINEPFNQRGLTNALKRFGKNNLSTAQETVYKAFATQLQLAMRLARKQPLTADSPAIQGLFKTLEHFDSLAAKAASNGGKVLKIREFIAGYAKLARHVSAFTGLAIVVGLLGFGVTAFNEWWSIFQYKRMVAAQKKSPLHMHVN